MRASRLLALLLMLQRRRASTAAQLAAELEVSLRTLYRDIAALAAAGVPLATSPGPGGGVRLAGGWQAQVEGLTAGEADALALVAAPQVAADLGLASLVANARAKMDATLPEALRGRARQLRERFFLDAPGWFARTEPLGPLCVIAEATWSARKLDLRYGQPPSWRRVEPLGLVLKAGTWYLVARHQRKLRTYRIGRVHAARVRKESFTRPTEFDLARHWREASASFDKALLTYPCRVRLSPRAQKQLPNIVPGPTTEQLLVQSKVSRRDGWLDLDLRLENEEVALGQLMALGDGVQVLAPAALRRRLAASARRMWQMNLARK